MLNRYFRPKAITIEQVYLSPIRPWSKWVLIRFLDHSQQNYTVYLRCSLDLSNKVSFLLMWTLDFLNFRNTTQKTEKLSEISKEWVSSRYWTWNCSALTPTCPGASMCRAAKNSTALWWSKRSIQAVWPSDALSEREITS